MNSIVAAVITFVLVIVLILAGVYVIRKLFSKKSDAQPASDNVSDVRHYYIYYFSALIGFMLIPVFLVVINPLPEEIKNSFWFSSGVVFYVVTMLGGIITNLVYKGCVRFFLGEEDEGILLSIDKKRAGILALIFMCLVLLKYREYNSCVVCVVLLLNYFSWIIIIKKEIGDNIRSLVPDNIETAITTYLLVLATIVYLIIQFFLSEDYQILCTDGLALGFIAGVLLLLCFWLKQHKDEHEPVVKIYTITITRDEDTSVYNAICDDLNLNIKQESYDQLLIQIGNKVSKLAESKKVIAEKVKIVTEEWFI